MDGTYDTSHGQVLGGENGFHTLRFFGKTAFVFERFPSLGGVETVLLCIALHCEYEIREAAACGSGLV